MLDLAQQMWEVFSLKEVDEYWGYTIEDRGFGLAAVFNLKNPYGIIEARGEMVLSAESLAVRIDNLTAQGLDASMSEKALTDLLSRMTPKP